MKRKRTFCAAAFAAAVITFLVGAPAQADSVKEFYSGKTVELIVGFSPGGGYDRYARALARHMGKHIPGNPTIIVRNMPGANGLVAANHIYTAAAKDGTVFGTFSRTIPTMRLLTGDEGVEFEATRFNWIGSLNNEVSVGVSWHTSTVKTWQDLRKEELVIAVTTLQDAGSTYSRILNNIQGTKVRAIAGYPGMSEMLLAMERGEADGVFSLSWSSAKSKKPDWIRDGKMNILLQLALKKHPDLPDVPLIMDIAETDEQRQMLTLLLSRETMGRPFAAPPGVPEDRVSALRAAFQATVKDPEFLADANKTRLAIDPISGEEIDDLLRDVYATPENVIAMTRAAIKE